METTSNIIRSELYNKILELVKRIPRENVPGDAPDASSVAYDLEQLFLNNKIQTPKSEQVKEWAIHFLENTDFKNKTPLEIVQNGIWMGINHYEGNAAN